MDYNKRIQQLLFSSKSNEIHTFASLKEQMLDKIFNIWYTPTISYRHITQMTIETILYQPLRSIKISFTCETNIISFGDD